MTSTDSHISLIDLSRQFSFEIDERIKQQICFAETLVVSCAHYEGAAPGADDYESEKGEGEQEGEDSDSTSTVSTKEQVQEEAKPEPGPFEIKDTEEIEEEEAEPQEDDDFYFYFFPSCDKPVAEQHSKESLILVDGVPKVNEDAKTPTYCTCYKDRKGKCTCHAVLPCKCGAKKKDECTCHQLKEICICDELNPARKCVCAEGTVCTCFPGAPKPVCTCDQVEKPCICYKYKFPSPVCACKEKSKWPGGIEPIIDIKEEEEGMEVEPFLLESSIVSKASFPSGEEYAEELGESAKSKVVEEEKLEPCECQKPDPKPRCFCTKGKKCICGKDLCVCGVQKSCVCESESNGEANSIAESDESRSICECPVPKECTCEAKEDDCKCFPKNLICICGDPEHCTCVKICDCVEPCICDTLKQTDECICLDLLKQMAKGLVCTCPCKDEDTKKLKKVRAGKEGYRWCHDVDPYHTFFDYAYGRHDKISYKEQEKERFKVLGLYDAAKDDVCPVHGPNPPKFEKKVRKPSIDCCSSVGGLTISVETLGDEEDKFLVQVVSRASKEGSKTGSKLVSIIDLNLHTLEENRHEHITKKGKLKERKSYMAICDNGYYNKVTRNCGDRGVIKRIYHTFEKAKNFLLEGANVVLMRYFAIQRHKGTITTETVLVDGTVCQSIYVCLGVSQAVVNGKPMYVVKIERHIIEPNGNIHQTLTALTFKGYIVSHEWADNNYILHINPLLKVDPDKDEIEQHAPLRERWREDLQLLSDYLDFKTTRASEGARYISENGKLTNTIRDYLQSILLLKPHDVVHFTRHYFHSALSSLDLPRDDYFDSCSKHVRYFYLEE